MISIIVHVILGISTAVIMRINGQTGIWFLIACVFVWPLYWFAFIFAHFAGLIPAKCAWCGHTVAGHANLEKWRAHYLDECQNHPLAIKLNRIQNYLDETDSKNTANRNALEAANLKITALEAELKPWREVSLILHKRMVEDIDKGILRGEG